MSSTPRKRLPPSNAIPIKLNTHSRFTLKNSLIVVFLALFVYFGTGELEKHKVIIIALLITLSRKLSS